VESAHAGRIGRAAAGVEVAGELRLCPMRAAACGGWRCCWSSCGRVVNGLLPSSLLKQAGKGNQFPCLPYSDVQFKMCSGKT
jgi:hypothetical protein